MDSEKYKYTVRIMALALVFITIWIFLLSDGINGFLTKERYFMDGTTVIDSTTGDVWMMVRKGSTSLDDLVLKKLVFEK